MTLAPSPLEQDMERIRTLFLQMCVWAESMVRQSVRSVVQRDAQLARSVIAKDQEVNRLEVEIDRRCLGALALRQPVGTDLRFLATVMKMVTDVERVGDLAVNICERGIELTGGLGVEPDRDLHRMGELAADMIQEAAQAFRLGDTERARGLGARDREVDALNRAAFGRWINAISNHPDQARRGLALASISRYLERVADHAVNLGEMVVFMVEGDDVRHVQG